MAAANGVDRTRAVGLGAVGLLLGLAAWYVLGSQAGLVPPVGLIAEALPGFFSDPETYVHIGYTGARVVIGLGLAVAAGIPAAIVLARKSFLGLVLGHYVRIALSIPSTIAALMGLFIFRRSQLGIILVIFIITWPYIVTIISERISASDRRLAEMATVYGFSKWMYLRHVLAPEVVPYTFAAVRNEHAHAWKVVVLAELFAIADGMGSQFTRAFDRFILIDAILWLLAFMAIFLIVEYLILRPLEGRALNWQATP